MTKRALSIVELLLTIALIGVAVGVLMVGYGNLRSIVQGTTQNRDQAVLYQAVAAFNLMGGDMSPIFNSGLNADEQAAVLTRVMQGSVTDAARKQRGEVSQMVGSDMVVVPMSSDKGIALLMPTPDINPKGLRVVITSPGKTVTGFVVVSKDSPLGGQSLAVDWNTDKGSQSRINGVTVKVLHSAGLAGARYADDRSGKAGSRYVWNEDDVARTGPGSGTVPTSGGGNVPTPTRLKYKAYYDSDLTFAQYIKPDEASGKGLKLLQFYREDGGPISANEVDLNEITLGGRPLNEKGMKLVQGVSDKSTPTLNLYITLNKVLPAEEWTQDVASLVVKVKPTEAGRKGGKDRSPMTGDVNDLLLIHALKRPLQTVSFNSDTAGALKVGNYVAILPQGVDDLDLADLPEGWVGAKLDGAPTLDSGNAFSDFFGMSGDGSDLLKLVRSK